MPRRVTAKAGPGSGKYPGARGRLYADLGAVLLLLAFTLLSARGFVFGGVALGMDAATQFYPWYSFLGESLRSGELPGWNPYQFSGAPFAGDPLSGWTYLPAMLLFTLLPLTAAAGSYVLLHLLLAGLFTYALARSLRMGAAGALLAAVAYEFTSYIYIRNTCCFAYVSVAVWLPLAILGVELAVRSRGWLGWGLWCGVSGLAVSQILASWLGQGSYYALLAIGGYVAYRTLLFPPESIRGLWRRLSVSALTGGAVLAFGFGLAAAGLLPRLEYNALSGLAGGYHALEGTIVGGFSMDDWYRVLRPPSLFYAGVAVLALALAAPFLGRGSATRFAMPYFVVLSLFALTFSGEATTLIHQALYLLPSLEVLHPYRPQRVMVIFSLGPALLAGAALTHLGERGRRYPALLALPALAALFLATRSTVTPPADPPAEHESPWRGAPASLLDLGVELPPGALVSLVLAVVLVAVYALLPARLVAARAVAAGLLAAVVFADLYGAGSARLERSSEMRGGDRIERVDLEEYYAPTGATEFLQDAGAEEPARYFGFDHRTNEAGNTVPYHIRFLDPDTRALEAENRATVHGGNLYSIQGYNAVHLARYDEYLEALNTRGQNYHDADIFPEGLGSPLLDLLNVRYITVPAETGSAGVEELEDELPLVYEDQTTRVLENTAALPRAWIVHDARQVEAGEALDLLDSGEVDPLQTALLEEPPPELESPEGTSGDRASVEGYGAHSMEVETSSEAAGLLVLGEVHYPAWRAYVDGEEVPLYRANHLLRAVPVPAGEHTVELRYESSTLTLGTAVSLVAAVVLLALAVVRVARSRSATSRERPEEGR
ncbi:MAG: YfhO family protein [Rubrobacter sp.]|nr:YfhO family protein [Rubrobacter sp.]